ncbi:MAG TPA: TerC family protein [Bacillota bacterium]|nr:TerC family protein [Bacillota bacterium]
MEGNFIIGLIQIMFINIVLSGDNAVVIALACRNLPKLQQKKAVFWGSAGAIILRVVLTFIAVWLLEIPFLQVLGSILLLWIAIKLLKGEGEEEELKSGSNIVEAIKTIILADLIMSLDNVVAVAGAAGGNMLLIGIGLALSIPLIVWGSQLLMKLMNRFPIIVTIGAALLGYTAGEMILHDKAVGHTLATAFPFAEHIIPVITLLLVIIIGKYQAKPKQDPLREVS